jgi:hypothetical protein
MDLPTFIREWWGRERGVERRSGAGMSGLMEGRRLSEGEAGWMLENSSRDRMIIGAQLRRTASRAAHHDRDILKHRMALGTTLQRVLIFISSWYECPLLVAVIYSCLVMCKRSCKVVHRLKSKCSKSGSLETEWQMCESDWSPNGLESKLDRYPNYWNPSGL